MTLLLALVLAGCGGAVTESSEYIELQAERDLLRGDVDERDDEIEDLEATISSLGAQLAEANAGEQVQETFEEIGSELADPDPTEPEVPEEPVGEQLSVFDLLIGDCFDVPSDEGDVEEVTVLKCSAPHQYEVYSEYNMTESAFPGLDEAVAQAEAVCLDRFTVYVGSDYSTSALGLDYLYPSAESWDEGDRIILCLLYDWNGDLLNGSMEGSGI